jgi:serine/tyrosine/threonine adenylyltransferase
VSALSPLLDSNTESAHVSEKLIASLKQFVPRLESTYARLMCEKMGLEPSEETLRDIVQPWLLILEEFKMDYSLSMRSLSDAGVKPDLDDGIVERWMSYSSITNQSGGCSKDNEDQKAFKERVSKWWNTYVSASKDSSDRTAKMNSVNPRYILRNNLVNTVIAQAQKGDFSGVNDYLQILENPFEEGTKDQQTRYGSVVPTEEQEIRCSCSS